MKPFTKQGEPIPAETWARMLHYAKILAGLGYREASQKPNLFYLNYYFVAVFVDFQNVYTEDGEPCARLYFDWKKNAPRKGTRPRRNAIEIEGMRLHNAGVKFRRPSIDDEDNLPLLIGISRAENPDID